MSFIHREPIPDSPAVEGLREQSVVLGAGQGIGISNGETGEGLGDRSDRRKLRESNFSCSLK